MPFYRCAPPSSGGGGGGGDLTDSANIIYYDENDNPHTAYLTQAYLPSPSLNLPWDSDFSNLIKDNGANIYNVYIGNKILSATSALGTYLQNIKGTITIGEGCCALAGAFNNSLDFNSPVKILWNGNTCYYSNFNNLNLAFAFQGAKNFNSPVYIENGNDYPAYIRINMISMYNGCINFNQPVTIPSRADKLLYIFNRCSILNSRITIKRNKYSITPYDIIVGFTNCWEFNQPMVFPKGLNNNLQSTLAMCNNFNQPVAVCFSDYTNSGESVNKIVLTGMFSYSNNMYSDIILFGNNLSSLNFTTVTGFIRKNAHTKRINIYLNSIDSSSKLLTTSTASILGVAVTWAQTTNGYYNETYNVYILNNVQDALNNFNNYYYNFYGEYPDFAE